MICWAWLASLGLSEASWPNMVQTLSWSVFLDLEGSQSSLSSSVRLMCPAGMAG